jgi:arylsulfatase A-like enzyme
LGIHDDIGVVLKKLQDMGVDNNTIVIFTTDNGTEVFTWPDGGQTPFAQSKGTLSAQSGHALVHCTCPLLGVERT